MIPKIQLIDNEGSSDTQSSVNNWGNTGGKSNDWLKSAETITLKSGSITTLTFVITNRANKPTSVATNIGNLLYNII